MLCVLLFAVKEVATLTLHLVHREMPQSELSDTSVALFTGIRISDAYHFKIYSAGFI